MARARASTGRHGGRRRGAGRATTKVRQSREALIKAQDEFLLEQTPELLAIVLKLARGGFERVQVKCQRAELIFVDRVVRNAQGEIERDERMRPVKEKVRAFPEAADGTWIEVERRTEHAEENLAAAKELLNRIFGRPRETPEREPDKADRLPDIMLASLKRAYGDKAEETPK